VHACSAYVLACFIHYVWLSLSLCVSILQFSSLSHQFNALSATPAHYFALGSGGILIMSAESGTEGTYEGASLAESKDACLFLIALSHEMT
jgi:hypothetical protein